MTGHHGMIWKSTQAFYDEVARVPLMIRWPGTIRPSKTDAAASLVDLPGTLLELTGQTMPAKMQGVSLAPVLRGASGARNEYVYRCSERVAQNPARTRTIAPDTPAELMIRGADWKYALYSDGEEFLYNLRKDPRETRNVADDASARATEQEMRSQLAAWLKGAPNQNKLFNASCIMRAGAVALICPLTVRRSPRSGAPKLARLNALNISQRNLVAHTGRRTGNCDGYRHRR